MTSSRISGILRLARERNRPRETTDEMNGTFVARGPVVERSTLWGNDFPAVFSVKVPQGARFIISPHAGRYLEWLVGRVQFFLKCEDASAVLGKRVSAVGKVCVKRYANSEFGVYVDFADPQDIGVRDITHDVCMHTRRDEMRAKQAALMTVSVPGTVDGIVAVYEHIPHVPREGAKSSGVTVV